MEPIQPENGRGNDGTPKVRRRKAEFEIISTKKIFHLRVLCYAGTSKVGGTKAKFNLSFKF